MNPADAGQAQQIQVSEPENHSHIFYGAGHAPGPVAPSAPPYTIISQASQPPLHPPASLLSNPQGHESIRKVVVESIPPPPGGGISPTTAPRPTSNPPLHRLLGGDSERDRAHGRRSRSRSRGRDQEKKDRSRDGREHHRDKHHFVDHHRRSRSPRSQSPRRDQHRYHSRQDSHPRQRDDHHRGRERSPAPRIPRRERSRSRSRSRSKERQRRRRSGTPERPAAPAPTPAPATLPYVPSPSVSPSKKIFHESTLVSLRTGAGPVSFPLQPSDLEEEELPPPSPVAVRRSLAPLIFGYARAQGLRPYMEDRHVMVENLAPVSSGGVPILDGVPRCFAAVYDGHNGCLAADHAMERLHHILVAEPALRTCTGDGPPAVAAQEEERMGAALTHAFEATDREILTRCRVENLRGGACGVVVVRSGDALYAAHCGDCRAVLCRRGEPLRLTEDHKPNLPRERKRVEALGGRVDFARCWRVIVDPGDGRPASGLAVSRSFGDPDFKEPLHLVIATPDVMRERLTPDDAFIILASDGLWDVMSDKQACDIVAMQLRAFSMATAPNECRVAATLAAETLVRASLEAGTMDNVTAVVGLLRWS